MKFGGTIKLFKRTSTLFKSGGAVDKTFDKVKKNIKPQNVNYAKKQFDILTRGVLGRNPDYLPGGKFAGNRSTKGLDKAVTVMQFSPVGGVSFKGYKTLNAAANATRTAVNKGTATGGVVVVKAGQKGGGVGLSPFGGNTTTRPIWKTSSSGKGVGTESPFGGKNPFIGTQGTNIPPGYTGVSSSAASSGSRKAGAGAARTKKSDSFFDVLELQDPSKVAKFRKKKSTVANKKVAIPKNISAKEKLKLQKINRQIDNQAASQGAAKNQKLPASTKKKIEKAEKKQETLARTQANLEIQKRIANLEQQVAQQTTGLTLPGRGIATAAAPSTAAVPGKLLVEKLVGDKNPDKEFEQFVEPDIGGADDQLETNLAEKPDIGTGENPVPDPENDLNDPQEGMSNPAEDLKEEDVQVQEYDGDPMTEPGQLPIELPARPEIERAGDPGTDTDIDIEQDTEIETDTDTEEETDPGTSREYEGDPMTEPGQLPIVLTQTLPEEQEKTEEEGGIDVQEYTGDPMAEGMTRLRPVTGEEPPPPPGEDPPPPPPPPEEEKQTGGRGKDDDGKRPRKKKRIVTFGAEEEEKIIDGETRRPYKVNFTAITPSGNNKVFYQADTLKGTIKQVPAGSVEVNPGLGLESMKVESTTSRNPLIKSKRDLLLRAERRGLL